MTRPGYYAFTLWGDPATAKGVKAAVVGGKVRTYKPTAVRNWQAAVIVQMTAHHFQTIPTDVPLRVTLRCYFTRPASYPKRKHRPHTVKPDCDNIAGRILDAIEKAPGLFCRDQQVTDLRVSKSYAGPDEPTRIEVEVYELTCDDRRMEGL